MPVTSCEVFYFSKLPPFSGNLSWAKKLRVLKNCLGGHLFGVHDNCLQQTDCEQTDLKQTAANKRLPVILLQNDLVTK